MNSCSSLKQKFDTSDRINQSIDNSLSIKHKFQYDVNRDGFTRDRDRILFTRAFRRLQHKTQIFSNEKGDHFRTRLTHTLEVTQIARSLARYLSVNEDLTEAIALGHDLGHAPFGHEGEKVLDDIMRGNNDLGKLIRIPLNFGGFKHNYNSVRVLDVVQIMYENTSGLNLSWQVLEGILKHTEISRCKNSESDHNNKCYDIKRFVNDEKLINRLHLIHDFSVTLEGQIVDIADEIAQRQHDIDDGLRAFSSSININELYKKFIKCADEIIEQMKNTIDERAYSEKEHIRDCIGLLEKFRKKLDQNAKSKKTLYKKGSLVRDIIEYFILDVLATTKYNCGNTLEKQNTGLILYIPPKKNEVILDHEIVSFSKIADKINNKIEEYIKKQILNSNDVNKFDGKANYIIKQLFKAYYKNPLQMPHYVLERLENKIKLNAELYSKIKIKSGGDSGYKQIKDIKFKNGDRNDIYSLLKVLKFEMLDEQIVNPKANLNFKDDYILKKELKRISSLNLNKLQSNDEKLLKCLLENNYAYLSTICDYIAGMSDNYAKKEYKELYLVD